MSLLVLLLRTCLADEPSAPPAPDPEPRSEALGHCLGLLCDSPHRDVLGVGAEVHAGLPQGVSAELKLRVRMAGSTACMTSMWHGFVLSGEPGLGGIRGAIRYEGMFWGAAAFGEWVSVSAYHPWGARPGAPTGRLYVGPSVGAQIVLLKLRGGALFRVGEGEPGALLDLSVGVGF